MNARFRLISILTVVAVIGCESDSNRIKVKQDVVPDAYYTEIKSYLDKLTISNTESKGLSKAISAKYRYLDNDGSSFRLIKETTVYLYYEGLKSCGVWDKPGAKAFGGVRVSTVDFLKGPVVAKVVAHKELKGGRNYFYILVNNSEGWIGRPYIHKDKAGSEFLMPNPLTGEKIRENYTISSSFIVSELKENVFTYVPSYESITWDSSIPDKYRQQGYSRYKTALSNGFDQAERLAAQYQTAH